MSDQEKNQLVDHLFRHESGKMVAVLTKIFGINQLELIQDVVQESFYQAIHTWKYDNIPKNPSAWLMQVAKRKAIDILRRAYQKDVSLDQVSIFPSEEIVDKFFSEDEISDSQLQMIFACCHPSLKIEDQIAFTLKHISGFSIREISKALLVAQDTVKQRLFRAKMKLRKKNIHLTIPTGSELRARLDTVLTILYLIFNEGYYSNSEEQIIRKDLCAEAMRLVKLITEHNKIPHARAHALLALMCYQTSRFESRIGANDEIILLAAQDRSKWNRDLIKFGHYQLGLSEVDKELSVYHIEATIAAQHCISPNFWGTNWDRLLVLYDLLWTYKPDPITRLNRIVVLIQLEKWEEIENELEIVQQEIGDHYLYLMVHAEYAQKRKFYEKAVDLLLSAYHHSKSTHEKTLISQKLESIRKVIPEGMVNGERSIESE